MKRTVLTLFAFCMTLCAFAQTSEGSINSFRKPAAEIEAITMAAPVPSTTFNSQYTTAVIASSDCRSVPIAELAASEVRIGGLRIDPKTFSQTREAYSVRLEVLNVATGATVPVTGIPANPKIKSVTWAPSGQSFAFTNTTSAGVDLYLVNAADAKAVKINTLRVNSIMGTPFLFLNDTDILYKSVPADRRQAPVQGLAKANVVQENLGERHSGLRTYQDLLNGPFDEEMFDYACTSILAVYTPSGTKTIGEPSVYRSLDPSPDGKYIMAVTEHHPYSYMETHRSWPSKQFIMDIEGKMVKMLNDGTVKKDKAESGKDDKDAKKEPKPSGFAWRADKPAVLTWNESSASAGAGARPAPAADADKKDGEKPEDKPEQTHTDKMYQCQAPFNFESDKQIVAAPEYRMGRVTWGNDGLAMYEETSSKQKFRRTVIFVPCDTLAATHVLFQDSTEYDSLGVAPVRGSVYTVRNSYGRSVIWTDAKNSYVYFRGTSRFNDEGFKYSFLDKVNIKDGKVTNLWNESGDMKESLIAITDHKKLQILETKESFKDVPNYYLTDVKKNTSRQVTHIENSVPQVPELITKQIVHYTRKDGLKCIGSLYLPAGYDPERDGRLPVLMWTYPYEYKSPAEAEKASVDRYKYLKPSYGSAQIWATQGYAVLDEFTMAILSENSKTEPNDRFLEQLIMSAEAAVDFICDSIKVGDRDRIGIGGHSYGGYMTANLLAHTRLFRAGVARSGGYNRSLTPYGFQSERRNFWKAKDLYEKMSPFNYADGVKDALLIIHGQQDDNMGTFPDQSFRLYQALVYHGATARYVQLPYEAHSYLGKETILDMLYETGAWLDKHVKNAKPREAEKKDK